MTQVIIDNKEYVIVSRKSYETLQKKAALKSKPEKTLSVEAARAYSKKLIKKMPQLQKEVYNSFY